MVYVDAISTMVICIASRYLPPNSARTGYATEGALCIAAQLSTDAVSPLRKVCVLLIKDCGSNIKSKHAGKHEARPPQVKEEEEVSK